MTIQSNVAKSQKYYNIKEQLPNEQTYANAVDMKGWIATQSQLELMQFDCDLISKRTCKARERAYEK